MFVLKARIHGCTVVSLHSGSAPRTSAVCVSLHRYLASALRWRVKSKIIVNEIRARIRCELLPQHSTLFRRVFSIFWPTETSVVTLVLLVRSLCGGGDHNSTIYLTYVMCTGMHMHWTRTRIHWVIKRKNCEVFVRPATSGNRPWFEVLWTVDSSDPRFVSVCSVMDWSFLVVYCPDTAMMPAALKNWHWHCTVQARYHRGPCASVAPVLLLAISGCCCFGTLNCLYLPFLDLVWTCWLREIC